jgi:hypothetical protein
MTLNAHLAKSTVIAALGGLLFGFDTAVISGTTAALTQNYQLSPKLLGITVASALWGTVIGSMLAGFTHWIMNALISGTFPLLAASSGGYPFVVFSLMMVVQFFVVLFVYPETKGMTLEEMQKKPAAS